MAFGTYRFARFTGIAVWLGASVLPIGPYTIPLFEGSLSDTPRAYLVWIPILAFVWSIWNLCREPVVERTRGGIGFGLALVVASGLWLTFGKLFWPVFFFRSDAGLLAWPVWSLGLAWVIFGIPVSKLLLRPLTYLVLVWPPIYAGILSVINPPLESLAVSAMTAFSRSVSWIRPDVTFGVFDVTTAKDIVPVFVSQACSGSDSVLALIILFPIMLIFFRISMFRQALLIISGSLLAFAANLLRIFVIIIALHAFGYSFAFDVLHPVLGAVMFFALVVALLWYGTRKQLAKPQTADPVERAQSRRGVGLWLAGSVAIAQTALLAPLYWWAIGSPLRPVTIVSGSGAHLVSQTAAVDGGSQTVVHVADSLGALDVSRPRTSGVVRAVHRVTVQPGIGGRAYVTSGACQTGEPAGFCTDTVVLLYAVQHYKPLYIRLDVLTTGGSTNASADSLLATRRLESSLVASIQK